MTSTIRDLLIILIGSSLVSNVVLSQFLGLCPFLGVSRKVETAAGMGAAVVFVITLASAVAGVIYRFVLVPLDITYLQTIVFILVIAALVQFVEMVLKKYMQGLYVALGVYLPLITTNCAVLGADQCAEELWDPRGDRERLRDGGRIFDLHRDSGRDPGKDGAQRCAAVVSGDADRAGDGRPDGDRVLRFCRIVKGVDG